MLIAGCRNLVAGSRRPGVGAAPRPAVVRSLVTRRRMPNLPPTIYHLLCDDKGDKTFQQIAKTSGGWRIADG